MAPSPTPTRPRHHPPRPPWRAPSPTPTTAPSPTPAAEPALVAKATGVLAVHAGPGDAPTSALPATTAFGTRTVALVTEVGEGPTDGWLEILLPVRPNGSTGWVRAEDVEPVLSTPAAIGDLETPDPAGAYGPYAIGLAAHSDVLTEFAGGDGQVGIHGTDDPTSIGQDVSHGCLRVPNEVIRELAHLLPLGTPVTIA